MATALQGPDSTTTESSTSLDRLQELNSACSKVGARTNDLPVNLGNITRTDLPAASIIRADGVTGRTLQRMPGHDPIVDLSPDIFKHRVANRTAGQSDEVMLPLHQDGKIVGFEDIQNDQRGERRTRFEFDPPGAATITRTDFNGKVTTKYNASGIRVSELAQVNSPGHVTLSTTSYDEHGRPTSHTSTYYKIGQLRNRPEAQTNTMIAPNGRIRSSVITILDDAGHPVSSQSESQRVNRKFENSTPEILQVIRDASDFVVGWDGCKNTVAGEKESAVAIYDLNNMEFTRMSVEPDGRIQYMRGGPSGNRLVHFSPNYSIEWERETKHNARGRILYDREVEYHPAPAGSLFRTIKFERKFGLKDETGESALQSRTYRSDGKLLLSETTSKGNGQCRSNKTNMDGETGNYITHTRVTENEKNVAFGMKTERPDGTYKSTTRSRDLEVTEEILPDRSVNRYTMKKREGRTFESISIIDHPDRGRKETVESGSERTVTTWDKNGRAMTQRFYNKASGREKLFVRGPQGWVDADTLRPKAGE